VLTGKHTTDGKPQHLLDIIDFGSRGLIALAVLHRKATARILITQLAPIERDGAPLHASRRTCY